ncbi:hypothetical protein IAR55_006093 [Kwoniella newhampshirensis]|uniref:Uncharacterized protein n=1 Tax=Kwoniella newhampshirensis TaxID=1651941 RepID=A0AAW0YUQ4_9TREE
MPASTKQIIALSLLAGASAAPLNLFGGGGGASATGAAAVGVGAAADIRLFANALINTATGGAVTATSTVSAQLGATVGITRSLAVNAWATGQCVVAHADIATCTEVSAYLSAVYYAFEQGWTVAQLLAALGADRVQKFQSVLQSVCAHEPTGTCSTLLAAWPTCLAAMAQVDVSVATSAAGQLTANGLTTLIDAAHAGTSLTAGLTGGLTANVNAAAGAGAGAGAKGGLGLGLNVFGLHLRDVETEHGVERRLFGLENILGQPQGQVAGGVNAATQVAGGLNIANLVQAAGSVTAGATATAQGQAQAAAGGVVPIVGGAVHTITNTVGHLPVVGNVLPVVGGLTHNIPLVGDLTGQVAAGANANAYGNAATSLVGSLNVPGLLSTNGALSAVANAAGQAAAVGSGHLGVRDLNLNLDNVLHSASGVLGTSASGLFHAATGAKIVSTSVGNGLDLDIAALAGEIAEGDVFVHEQAQAHVLHQRDLLSGLLSNPTGALGSLPVVGNVGGILSNPTGLLHSLPVGNVLNSLPIGNAAGILHNPTGILNGLPIVGGVTNTLTDTLGHLPVVGGLAATAQGAVSSATNAGLNLGPNGLNLGLNDVTQLAGGLAGQGGLHIKRSGLLSGLPILGSLPVGNIVDSLPLVNALPVGNVLNSLPISNVAGIVNGLPVLGNVVNAASHLPIVGDVLDKVTHTVGGSSLPVVGGLTGAVTAAAQGQASSINNLGLNLGPQGLTAGLNDVTSAAGSILGSAALHTKRSLLSGLPLVGSLPLVNNLPIVGSGSASGLTNGLPVVGNLLGGSASGLTNGIPVVGNVLNGLTSKLPIVGGLTHSLPLIGGSASTAAQGSASTFNNLGLGVGQNGLAASLSDLTRLTGGLVGSGSLAI